MNFFQAISSGFRNYFNFSGRAPRSEYWYWMLFTILGSILAWKLDQTIFNTSSSKFDPINSIFGLAVCVPSWAVWVRRLHDVNRSGWWVLMTFTIIGIIYPLLVWECTKGDSGDNRFGSDPLSGSSPPLVKN